MDITNTEVWGFKHALRGMRNPMNSWNRADSHYADTWDAKAGGGLMAENGNGGCSPFYIGENDLDLAKRLIKAGGEHRKFLRMIHVSADVNMPRYWWSEEDTYHFNVKNSCSTMHKLLNNPNPITRELFLYCEEDEDIIDIMVERLERLRQEYKSTKNYEQQTRLLVRAKRLLPEGFLQMRTLDTNYEELRNEYFQRRSHRLSEEWADTFCRWIEGLPYAAELICCEWDREDSRG